MDKQPEALRLAELEAMHERGTIRRGHIDEMLTELRRLHEVNQELLEALEALRKTPYMPPALIGIFDDLIAKAKAENLRKEQT